MNYTYEEIVKKILNDYKDNQQEALRLLYIITEQKEKMEAEFPSENHHFQWKEGNTI